jgi:translation elongation factor EF-Tu-like GTPase
MAELVEVEILIERGGKRIYPIDPNSKSYRPHFKVGSEEELLGVQFESGPSVIELGERTNVVVKLLYHPHVSYDKLQAGQTFYILEGSNKIGEGRVLRRWSD